MQNPELIAGVEEHLDHIVQVGREAGVAGGRECALREFEGDLRPTPRP
jgi:hypothetical protein